MVMFYKNELQIYVLQELQQPSEPASTRELAQRMLAKGTGADQSWRPGHVPGITPYDLRSMGHL